MAKTKVVEAKNIKKTFLLGENSIEVLKGLTFEIESGEFVIIFGPSGCGKSTLLNIISGLENVSDGSIKIRGEQLEDYNPKQMAEFRQSKIGIVFQSFNLLKSMTTQENVALPLLAGGDGYSQAMRRAEDLLTMIGLKDHLRNIPTELSGGQQQRVAMARALATNPWILICDEPTGNLDSKSSEEVMSIFNTLNQRSKKTIIMVTHNPDYLKYADKVFHMKDGLIAETTRNSKRVAVKDVGGFKPSEHLIGA
ncbi:MAG: ABC transporter ATP-binding protein [Candidatus Berkelbacteria bacterium]|nr:ABC transporter ATP-binding protein [Candidatus Berkelbacteria bacterium]